MKLSKKIWRYHRGNQNSYIEEEQTKQLPKEKGQTDNQRSTKHTHKTKDRVTQTPLRIGGEIRCSGGVDSSCSTSGTRRGNLASIPIKISQVKPQECTSCLHSSMTIVSFVYCIAVYLYLMKAEILRNYFMGALLLCYAHRSLSRSIIMQIRQISRTFKKVLIEKSLYISIFHSKNKCNSYSTSILYVKYSHCKVHSDY